MSYLTEKLSKLRLLTGNSAGLRTAFSSRLSHSELRSTLRESHSFLNLPADTTMASSQSNHLQHPFLAIHSADEHRMIYYHFLLHVLRFLLFFSDNIMTDVASKQQTTALFLSTIATRTRRHTELTKKTDDPDGKPMLLPRTFSSVFRAVTFTQTAQFNLECMGPFTVSYPVNHNSCLTDMAGSYPRLSPESTDVTEHSSANRRKTLAHNDSMRPQPFIHYLHNGRIQQIR